jgi:hypothetical protein
MPSPPRKYSNPSSNKKDHNEAYLVNRCAYCKVETPGTLDL